MAALPKKRSVSQHPDPHLEEAVIVSRFWRLIDASGGPDACWLWRGDRDRDGYGIFIYRGRRYGAHELALSFSTGEVRTTGLDTCHSCDTPPCCNPLHLRFDTRAANVGDMRERGRAKNGSTRLTNEDVEMIRNRRANGARQKDLAADFEVCEGYISEIVRGKRWATAGGPIDPGRTYRRG